MPRDRYTRNIHKRDERARRIRERELRELMKELRAEWEMEQDEPEGDSETPSDE